MKRKLLILSLLTVCVAMLALGTAAFYSSGAKAHNVITTGQVDIDLLEWANEDKTEPFEDLDGIMPKMTVTKIVEVKNTGVSDAWVRVQITKSITLTNPQLTPDLGLVKLDLNTADWTEDGGYYYYNRVLKPGETTAPLFNTVTFDKTMGNEYQNATAAVDIVALAVQSANNGGTALEAAGWPSVT